MTYHFAILSIHTDPTCLHWTWWVCICVYVLQVIYMARNPKDLVVSYYQFHRSLRTMSYRGTFQEFCRRFMNDKCEWDMLQKSLMESKQAQKWIRKTLTTLSLSLSAVGYGSWFEHVQEFWEHRMDSNVLFLKYEDMYKVHALQFCTPPHPHTPTPTPIHTDCHGCLSLGCYLSFHRSMYKIYREKNTHRHFVYMTQHVYVMIRWYMPKGGVYNMLFYLFGFIYGKKQ